MTELDDRLQKIFNCLSAMEEKEFDKEALAELEKEVEKTNNWDDYEIPESLPQPKERKDPKLWIPLLGGSFG